MRDDLLACPFCEGRGQMPRSEIVNRLEDPELPEKIVNELARSSAQAQQQPVLAGGNGSVESEFEDNVRHWTRRVFWRRSAKE